ncbi:hypothetical protein NBRC3257_1723 [Gluconobacter thailandicus NBRC 3257]|uniref:Uncharacterized protein n=1 Tax=Gluconobacter thailandicus NBRC 3257 TaxID=1381097 RepID=A0ABQ0IWZ3_GLUTH|nr:hypothetical protein B932_1674 [Gluconobacter oxydans H24]GAC88695.1 hypothetical protein NBRC3255_2356 [Gluconobacter thailandicus NBRC 3255]GAD26724.1 hypothetical protein NBRC3257_1723 [Gluconobacter thailandicus NBRC 3257]
MIVVAHGRKPDVSVNQLRDATDRPEWQDVLQKRKFEVGGLLLPGALPNRAYRLCSDSEHLRVIIGTCKFSPMTVVQCRAKDKSLPCASSLFRPHGSLLRGIFHGGDAGHCPRVHNTYFTYRLSP